MRCVTKGRKRRKKEIRGLRRQASRQEREREREREEAFDSSKNSTLFLGQTLTDRLCKRERRCLNKRRMTRQTNRTAEVTK